MPSSPISLFMAVHLFRSYEPTLTLPHDSRCCCYCFCHYLPPPPTPSSHFPTFKRHANGRRRKKRKYMGGGGRWILFSSISIFCFRPSLSAHPQILLDGGEAKGGSERPEEISVLFFSCCWRNPIPLSPLGCENWDVRTPQPTRSTQFSGIGSLFWRETRLARPCSLFLWLFLLSLLKCSLCKRNASTTLPNKPLIDRDARTKKWSAMAMTFANEHFLARKCPFLSPSSAGAKKNLMVEKADVSNLTHPFSFSIIQHFQNSYVKQNCVSLERKECKTMTSSYHRQPMYGKDPSSHVFLRPSLARLTFFSREIMIPITRKLLSVLPLSEEALLRK